jgi:cellulose biosynthesis protein BcsQ
MTATRPPGRILTFYSYKGGTGRSMALANIAWILASSGRRVLAIDWDLEAPGLHRYFRPFLIDEELSASDGLMDLVDAYATQAIQPIDPRSTPDPSWYLEYADFTDYVISVNFNRFPGQGKIDLLPAGRQNDRYAITVNSFNWQNFFDRLGGGGFFEAVKAKARADYDYVLIDSRTGVSDTAGICSVQMPDSLIVCFTYNNQSIKGAAAVAASAITRRGLLDEEQRANRRAASSEGRSIENTPAPYRVFPVPMRVESGESERLAIRQTFARQLFAGLTDHLAPSIATEYWGAVEIPHKAFYAYEEVLATFKDDALDPKTVLAAFVRLTGHISDRDVEGFRQTLDPGETQAFLNAFARTAQGEAQTREARQESVEETLVRTAGSMLASFTEDERQIARRVLGRLVRLARDEEGGGYFPIRAAVKDFPPPDSAVIVKLADAGVLAVSSSQRANSRSASASQSSGEQTVGFADERLLRSWKVLLDWLDADRDFLLWRQQLRTYWSDWERSSRAAAALLSGPILREAEHWQHLRPKDLNPAETSYIADSRRAADDATMTQSPTTVMPPIVVRRSETADSDVLTVAREQPSRSRTMVWAGAFALLVIALGLFWYLRQPTPRPGDMPLSSATDGTPTTTVAPGRGSTGAQAATSAAQTPTKSAAAPPPAPPPPADQARLDGLVAQGDGYYAAGNVVMAREAYAKALSLDASSVAASSGLRRVNDGDQSTEGRVVLQYASAADGLRVKDLAATLTTNLTPLSVAPPETVPGKSGGDVRYFFPEDEKLAERVKRATEFALAKRDLGITLTVIRRDAKQFPRAARGTIEVWLPPLPRRRASAY